MAAVEERTLKDPIEVLMGEHRVIEQALAAIAAAREQDVSLSFYEDLAVCGKSAEWKHE